VEAREEMQRQRQSVPRPSISEDLGLTPPKTPRAMSGQVRVVQQVAADPGEEVRGAATVEPALQLQGMPRPAAAPAEQQPLLRLGPLRPAVPPRDGGAVASPRMAMVKTDPAGGANLQRGMPASAPPDALPVAPASLLLDPMDVKSAFERRAILDLGICPSNFVQADAAASTGKMGDVEKVESRTGSKAAAFGRSLVELRKADKNQSWGRLLGPVLERLGLTLSEGSASWTDEMQLKKTNKIAEAVLTACRAQGDASGTISAAALLLWLEGQSGVPGSPACHLSAPSRGG
jgi:hypothetical protein